jgi:hypothetical protein
MLTIKSELEKLNQVRNFVAELMDGNNEAFAIIYYIKCNYKEWAKMLRWLESNNLKGQLLVDCFKHESPDNGGYLLGCTHILSRIKGNKTGLIGVKIDELN